MINAQVSFGSQPQYRPQAASAQIAPAIITLTKSDGESVILPAVKAAPYAFHQSVADFLLSNTAMPITTEQSRDVVAIMQAAEESALINARPVTANLLSQ